MRGKELMTDNFLVGSFEALADEFDDRIVFVEEIVFWDGLALGVLNCQFRSGWRLVKVYRFWGLLNGGG